MTRRTTRWSRGPRLVPLLKGTARSGLQRGPPKPERQVETMESQTWSLCSETWGSSGEAHVPGGPDAKGLAPPGGESTDTGGGPPHLKLPHPAPALQPGR